MIGVALLASCKDAPTPRQDAASHLELEGRRAQQWQAFEARLEQSASPPLTGFVLVPHDVPLHATAEAARVAPITALKRRAPASAPAALRATAYEVLEDGGQVVRVRSLSPTELTEHCASALPHPQLAALEVRGWVPKRALLPVLTQAFTQSYEDKTAYAFAAGSPVWSSSIVEGAPVVLSANGFQTGADVPLEHVGYGYEQARSALIGSDDKPLYLSNDTVLWLDRAPLVRAEELSPGLRIIRQQRDFGDGQHVMVALSTPCLKLAALTTSLQANASTSVRNSAIRLPPATDVSPEAELVELKEGATLSWPDGSPAATARQRFTLRAIPVEASSSKRCYETPFPLGAPLCLDGATSPLPPPPSESER